MPLRSLVCALALFALLLTAGPAGAAADGPLFAAYWHDFLAHWSGTFQRQNGVVMLALGLGAVCLFVITRGKWRK